MNGHQKWAAERREEARPRGELAIRLRRKGMKWREVAEKLGVSQQRAVAIARNFDPDICKQRPARARGAAAK